MIASINALVDLQQASTQPVHLPVPASESITADVLRTDKIHATISGNKWFKLKYNLQHAISRQQKNIVTFGGAYSNHLAATAYACARMGVASTGFIRGEEPSVLSHTMEECRQWGMQLQFISREIYGNARSLHESILQQMPDAYIIPEGGCNEHGIAGAGEMLDLLPYHQYTHICCAIGTGTMFAGIVNRLHHTQQAIGIPVIKIPGPENELAGFLAKATGYKENYSLHYNYHFGGYARKTPQLTGFMNEFFQLTGIPTDFVYTAKLMFAITDLAANNHFPPGSRVLIIHSGGLQGNRSLPKNTLVF
jgi:1-aminocyclopropane-1-carboxylate deaminase